MSKHNKLALDYGIGDKILSEEDDQEIELRRDVLIQPLYGLTMMRPTSA